MKGTMGIGELSRIIQQNSIPSVMGIITSEMIKSGRTSFAFSNPSSPLPASVTSYPAFSRLILSNFRTWSLLVEAEEKGEIVFKKGQMLYGEYGSLTGEDAIYQVVPQTKGYFRFEPGEKDTTRNIQGSTMNVLIEACRLSDEKGIAG